MTLKCEGRRLSLDKHQQKPAAYITKKEREKSKLGKIKLKDPIRHKRKWEVD